MNKILVFLFIVIVLLSVLGPFFVPYDPFNMDLGSVLKSPSIKHIFGTDNQGRDVFSRIIYGGRVSLGIGILALLFSLVLGVLLGIVSGFFGGAVDKVVNLFVDITLSFPSLLLAIGIGVILPNGVWSVVLALGLSGWALFARFTRGLVWEVKNNKYIESARALGAGDMRIMTKHILPNCISLIAVTGFMKLGTFILSEASLSFLGLGVPPPYPTWGGMINYGREFIQSAPWMVIFPGIFLSFTVIVCNMLGDNLRDRLDKRGYSKGL